MWVPAAAAAAALSLIPSLASGAALSVLPSLEKRGDCSTIQVNSGDSCGILAQRCGISGAQFTQYNSYNKNLCSTLAVGQHVCCSAGTLPSFAPKPNPDGSCATHLVAAGEYCSLIASTYSVTVDNLETYNKQTWGWSGCANLQAAEVMCISTGTPPMPQALPNAVCGPQVPGTKKPSDMTQLWSLNQCPLNACCDIWGQCGTTTEFCTMTKSATGAPGTAAKGTNGCISNCGTTIINNAVPPTQFRKIGYFESWNGQRPCLTMTPNEINTTRYTHIHYGFGSITSGTWAVDVSQYQSNFDQFAALSGVKRVISFGGWAFSTDASTYSIFRQAVTDGNYKTFASNIVKFLNANNLDGVDIDWEYPGEQDIPGIPPSSKVDSAGYLTFLQYLRSIMPSGKSISVAAPASYWYLKGFPIRAIAEAVDYIVYMTYDLHGQWDYNNKWADPGCPGGSCLRSHVNLTETMNSLSMITKAGVAANQVVVGVASYGRSFAEASPGCSGPMCTFTGPSSGAVPGRCTQTGGYISNAEILEIAGKDSSAKVRYDSVSDSQIMTWGGNQWVAYMDNGIKASRISNYMAKNFGGWVEWAIDLEDFGENNGGQGFCSDCAVCQSCPISTYPLCNGHYNSLDDINNDLANIPVYCVDVYQIQVLSDTLNTAFANYSDLVNNNYDSKFGTYAGVIKDAIPQYLLQFVNDNRNKYFTCSVADIKGTTCPWLPSLDNWDGTHGGGGAWSFTNETGFYADLAATYGIDQSWVHIGEYKSQICAGRNGCVRIDYTGVPMANSDITVPNPKNIITSALPMFQGLVGMLGDAALNSQNAYYVSGGDNGNSTMGDAVMGGSMPVFMMQSAIASMQNVVEVAHKADEQKAKEIILGFIGAVLFIIPGIGEALEGADLAVLVSLGRLISLAGDVGNTAFDIYGAVQDPDSAIFAVFDGLSVAKSFSKAADGFKALKASDVNSLGDTVKNGAAAVNKGCLTCI